MFKIFSSSSFIVVIILALLSHSCYAQNKRVDKGSIVVSKHENVDSKITDYYLHAIKEMSLKKDTLSALEYLKKSYALDSMHAPTLYMISVLSKDLSTSITAAERAVKENPSNFWYKSHLSSIYSSAKKYDKSLELMLDLHKRGDRNISTFKYISALYDVQGNVDMAQATIDSALVLYGRNPELLSYRGELYKRQNRIIAYISNCKELNELIPNNVHIKYELGIAYAMNKRDSLAFATFHEAYEIDSTFVPLLNNLSYHYANAKDKRVFRYTNQLFKSKQVSFDKKELFFNEYIRNSYFYTYHIFDILKLLEVLRKAHNYDYQSENMYAYHHIAMNNRDKALEVYDKFIDNDSIDIEIQKKAYSTVISLTNMLNRRDSTLNLVDRALVKFKGDSDQYQFLAYILSVNEEHEKAIKILKKEAKNEKDSTKRSEYYGSIADMFHKEESSKGALRYCKIALKYNPENILVLNNYAYYLSLEHKNLEQALIMSKKTLKLEPSNPIYLDTYAWILYLLGRYDEAKRHQQKAVALDTDKNHEILRNYGDILVALGENLTARIYYQRALDAGADKESIEKRLEKIK